MRDALLTKQIWIVHSDQRSNDAANATNETNFTEIKTEKRNDEFIAKSPFMWERRASKIR